MTAQAGGRNKQPSLHVETTFAPKAQTLFTACMAADCTAAFLSPADGTNRPSNYFILLNSS